MNALLAITATCLAQTTAASRAPVDHIVSTGPTAAEILIRGLIAASVYGVLGIALMLLGFKLFDAITPKIDVQRELAENRNIAVAIVVGAMLLGLAVMLARVISA